MADCIDDLAEPVDINEQKPEPRPESGDDGAADVRRRFDAVDLALAEQRECTSLGYDRLEGRMNVGFERTESRFGRLERKLDQIIALHLRQRAARRSAE